MLVSSPRDETVGPGTGFGRGAVYAFVHDGRQWIEQAKFTSVNPPIDPFYGNYFGYSIAIEGDRALIGAYGEEARMGAMYIFERNGGVWSQQARLTATVRFGEDRFGEAVAIQGDYAITGATHRDSNNPIMYDDGAIFVFKRTASGWVQIHELISPMPSIIGWLGYSVAMDNGLIVGGARDETTAILRAGAVHVFGTIGPDCPGETVWGLANSGDFNDSLHWMPKVPGPLNDAMFSAPAPIEVDFSSSVHNLSLEVDSSDVDLYLNSNVYTLGSLVGPSIAVASDDTEDVPHLTFIGPGEIRNYSSVVGESAGSRGELTLTGAATRWIMQGDLTVGAQGDGSLNVLNGAHVINRNATMGQHSGSRSFVSVDGPGSEWQLSFLLTIDNGSLSVTNGGSVTSGIVGFFGGIFLYNNGEITGDSDINATVVNFGSFNPGLPGDAPATLTLNGNYAQVGQLPNQGSRTGRFKVEIDGRSPSATHDVLDVNGQASLGGGLFVRLNPGTSLNDRQPPMEILRANNFNASYPTFDVAFLPAMQGHVLRVNYPGSSLDGANAISLTVHPLESFLNFDSGSFDLDRAPTAAVAADFDGNGFDDLAVTLPAANPNTPGQVVVLLSDPKGGFITPITSYTVGVHPAGIVVGRFDRDTALDLAVVHKGDGIGSGNAMTLLNDGSGGFSVFGAPVPVGINPRSIAAGRFFSNSGQLDLAVANEGSNNVMVLRNLGNGGFVNEAQPIAVGPKPTRIRAGDVDNPRDLQSLVVLSEVSQTVSVHFNNGFGSYPNANAANSFSVGSQPRDMIVADLNNDGRLDVVTANAGEALSSEGSVSILVSVGGTLAPAVNLPIEGSRPFSLVAANLDQIASINKDVAVLVDTGSGTKLRILRNDSDQPTPQVPSPTIALTLVENPVSVGNGAVAVVTGDLDGKNGTDLVTINGPASSATDGEEGSLRLLLNLGTERPPPPPPAPCPADIAPPGGDSVVGVPDLLAVIASWGPCPPSPSICRADIAPTNGDGIVGVPDLLGVISRWGSCPR